VVALTPRELEVLRLVAQGLERIVRRLVPGEHAVHR
jgi:DNA-binding CsgD family transcriptional regulator